MSLNLSTFLFIAACMISFNGVSGQNGNNEARNRDLDDLKLNILAELCLEHNISCDYWKSGCCDDFKSECCMSLRNYSFCCEINEYSNDTCCECYLEYNDCNETNAEAGIPSSTQPTTETTTPDSSVQTLQVQTTLAASNTNTTINTTSSTTTTTATTTSPTSTTTTTTSPTNTTTTTKSLTTTATATTTSPTSTTTTTTSPTNTTTTTKSPTTTTAKTISPSTTSTTTTSPTNTTTTTKSLTTTTAKTISSSTTSTTTTSPTTTTTATTSSITSTPTTSKATKQVSRLEEKDITSEAKKIDDEVKNKTIYKKEEAENILNGISEVFQANTTELRKSNEDKKDNSLNKLLEAVESVGRKLEIPENQTGVVLETDVIRMEVLKLESQDPDPILGLRLTGEGNVSTFKDDDTENKSELRETSITLPKNFILGKLKNSKNATLILNVFKKVDIYKSAMKEKSDKLASKVISGQFIVDGKQVTDLGGNFVELNFHTETKKKHNQIARCVYWNYTIYGGKGGWDDEGCEVKIESASSVSCQCNHLTSFAVLFSTDDHKSSIHSVVLSRITIIGLSLSIGGLMVSILSFIFVKKLRQGRPQKTLFNLSIALVLSWIVFILATNKKWHYPVCISLAALLHYLILTSFMWMLMEAILQYLMFVKVISGSITSKYVLKTGIVSWVSPLLPVAVIFCIDTSLYENSKPICWMSDIAMYYSFALPIGLIVLVNLTLFIMVVVSLVRRPDVSGKAEHKRRKTIINIRASCVCFFILGLTWVFGFLAMTERTVIFEYLFCITSSLQGFVIFAMMTARNKTVQQFWLRVCCSCAGKWAVLYGSEETPKSTSSFQSTKSSFLSQTFDRIRNRNRIDKSINEASTIEDTRRESIKDAGNAGVELDQIELDNRNEKPQTESKMTGAIESDGVKTVTQAEINLTSFKPESKDSENTDTKSECLNSKENNETAIEITDKINCDVENKNEIESIDIDLKEDDETTSFISDPKNQETSKSGKSNTLKSLFAKKTGTLGKRFTLTRKTTEKNEESEPESSMSILLRPVTFVRNVLGRVLSFRATETGNDNEAQENTNEAVKAANSSENLSKASPNSESEDISQKKCSVKLEEENTKEKSCDLGASEINDDGDNFKSEDSGISNDEKPMNECCKSEEKDTKDETVEEKQLTMTEALAIVNPMCKETGNMEV